MRKPYHIYCTNRSLFIALLAMLLSISSLTASADNNPFDVTLGTYDESTAFVDAATGSKCYIQPDGTVFIIPWTTGTYDSSTGEIVVDHTASTIPSGDVTVPSSVTAPDGTVYTVSGIARDSYFSGFAQRFTKITLPESVKVIDARAFGGSESATKEIVIPGVETIGYAGFSSMSALNSVSGPKVKTIYDGAFTQCTAMTSVDMPELETTYPQFHLLRDGSYPGDGIFSHCESLSSVNFPKLKDIGAKMFFETNSTMTKIDFPEVEETYFCSLEGLNSLQEINLPKCRTLHLEHSGSSSTLRKINCPNVERMNSNGFRGCDALDTIDMPNLVSIFNVNYGDESHIFSFSCSNVKVINLPKFTGAVDQSLFNSCQHLEKLILSSVTDWEGFANPQILMNVKVLDIRGVKDLSKETYGFWMMNLDTLYCNNAGIPRRINIGYGDNNFIEEGQTYHSAAVDYPGFKYVYVANQTEEMNDSTFDHIPHIQTLVFGPDCDTKQINGVALSEIPDLQTVTIDGTGTDNISVDGVVYSSDGKTLVAYPRANEGSTVADGKTRQWQLTDEKMSTITHIAQGALRNYGKVHELKFGAGLAAIDRKAFENSHIDRVAIDADAPLTAIGADAFRNMTETNFRYLKMPTALTTIGSGAFYGDTQLQALELPGDALTTVGDNAFAGQTAITSIALPNSVTTIGANAFKGNTAMEYFTIPASCTSIGAGAFDGCSALTMVNAQAAQPATATGAFPESFKTNAKLFVSAENKDNYSAWADNFCDIITSQSVSGIQRGKFYTFSRSYPVDLNNNTTIVKENGLRFYLATGVSEENSPEGYIGVVSLKRLSGNDLSAIPANTPLVIYAPNAGGGDAMNFDYAMSASAPTAVESPVKGTPAAIRLDQTEEGTDLTNYILVHPSDGDYQSGEFHRVRSSEWNEVATRKGQQAYLQVNRNVAAGARAFRFSFSDSTTGIDSISAEGQQDNGKWYNLEGQQVGSPRRGIFIHDKKKIAVR